MLVPPAPGLLCAIGDLVADFRDEFAQTYIRVLEEADPRGRHDPRRARRAGAEWLDNEGIPADARSITYTADMRYHRQGYEIPVAIDPDEVKGGLDALEERFNGLHEQLYGFRMPGTACEIVNLRDRLGRRAEAGAAGRQPGRRRRVRRRLRGARDRVQGERLPTKIYDRAKLAPGNRFDGPAIVTEFDSTTVVLPGYAAEVDVNFNILINPKA